MIYLAGPFTDPDHITMAERAHLHGAWAVHCANRGHVVYSPIAAWKWAIGYGLPTTWEFWRPMSLGMLRHASELWVLELPGWETSVGVLDEIKFAENAGIPVRYFSPEDYREVRHG